MFDSPQSQLLQQRSHQRSLKEQGVRHLPTIDQESIKKQLAWEQQKEQKQRLGTSIIYHTASYKAKRQYPWSLMPEALLGLSDAYCVRQLPRKCRVERGRYLMNMGSLQSHKVLLKYSRLYLVMHDSWLRDGGKHALTTKLVLVLSWFVNGA